MTVDMAQLEYNNKCYVLFFRYIYIDSYILYRDGLRILS